MVELDDIDIKIINALQSHSGAHLSDIGKRLCVNHVAILKRLRRIEKSKILKISALVNPIALELKFATVLKTLGLRFPLNPS